MNLPNWLWWLLGLLILLAVLYLVGVRFRLTTGNQVNSGAVPVRII